MAQINNIAIELRQIAQYALHEELITYPKPGLVSHIDNGSHKDMDYATFTASINVLGKYFENIASAGMIGKDFTVLEGLGIQAEEDMLGITGGVNTHRGAIFILGILIAVTAYCLEHKIMYTQIGETIKCIYGTGISQHKIKRNSHGDLARKVYNGYGIIDAACDGFPLVFSALNQFRIFLQRYTQLEAKLLTFFYIMQHLDDTNLVYRGGVAALEFAKDSSRNILRKLSSIKLVEDEALGLHHEFMRQNLSPGGCADILSAVLFIHEIERLFVIKDNV